MYQLVDYMRAAIRAQDPAALENWDDETVRAVFHLLPDPAVGFNEWRDRMNCPDVSTDEIHAANERFIAFVATSRDAGTAFDFNTHAN